MSCFRRWVVGVVWLLGISPLISAKTAASKRVLVVLQDHELRKTHSMFFEDLKTQGFSLTYKKLNDPTLTLDRWGDYQFDNLVLFAPACNTFGSKNNLRDVVEFVDSGRNVLLVVDSTLSKKTIDLGTDMGVDFEPAGSAVYDHIHFAWTPESEGGELRKDHSLLVVEPEIQIRDLFNKRKKTVNSRPLLYRGIGQSLDPQLDHSIVAVAGASTSYSFAPNQDPTDESQLLIGKDTTLISLMQTTNNGRIAVVGSLEFFSNDLFTTSFVAARNHEKYESSGNQEFAQDLAFWTFGLLGVLQASPPRHFKMETGLTPNMYTITDNIRFEIDILEFVMDRWVPYKSKDIQLEYYMMDPYIRTCLKDEGNGTFALNLKAPDVYGVFKFLVKHHSPGYSYIDVVEMAPIRPFRHNEFERFILAAYPYYCTVFSMMIGFWILSILFLYHK